MNSLLNLILLNVGAYEQNWSTDGVPKDAGDTIFYVILIVFGMAGLYIYWQVKKEL